MRIVHCVASLETRRGGPSVSVPTLASSLARIGNEVTLLAIGAEPAIPQVPGLTVRCLPPSFPSRLGCSAALARHVAELDADVYHSHGLWLRTLHYLDRRSRATGCPHVVSPRGMMADWSWARHPRRKAFANRFVHPGALSGASGWHATGPGEESEIRSRGYSQPVCVAPNGVAAPDAAATEEARRHWTTAAPEFAAGPTALFYSRFHAKKRVLELIDLWIEVAPPDWRLLVVGIPEEYSVAQLSEYVHRNLAGDRIRIFDGSNVPAPYAIASLFLLPSHTENFGLVVAEALANSLPVITTDTTPWSAIGPAGLGWCVPWREFAATVRTALSEGTGRLGSRGAAAREWVLKEYSWDTAAHRLAGFYAELRGR